MDALCSKLASQNLIEYVVIDAIWERRWDLRLKRQTELTVFAWEQPNSIAVSKEWLIALAESTCDTRKGNLSNS